MTALTAVPKERIFLHAGEGGYGFLNRRMSALRTAFQKENLRSTFRAAATAAAWAGIGAALKTGIVLGAGTAGAQGVAISLGAVATASFAVNYGRDYYRQRGGEGVKFFDRERGCDAALKSAFNTAAAAGGIAALTGLDHLPEGWGQKTLDWLSEKSAQTWETLKKVGGFIGSKAGPLHFIPAAEAADTMPSEKIGISVPEAPTEENPDIPVSPEPLSLQAQLEELARQDDLDRYATQRLHAAMGGNAQALKDTALEVYYGRHGYTADPCLGRALMEEAADRGNTQAIRDLPHLLVKDCAEPAALTDRPFVAAKNFSSTADIPAEPLSLQAQLEELARQDDLDRYATQRLHAAMGGNAQALKDTALEVYYGRHGYTADPCLGRALMEEAADRGNTQAIRDLPHLLVKDCAEPAGSAETASHGSAVTDPPGRDAAICNGTKSGPSITFACTVHDPILDSGEQITFTMDGGKERTLIWQGNRPLPTNSFMRAAMEKVATLEELEGKRGEELSYASSASPSAGGHTLRFLR